jgi:RHS repeat-associated protein
VDTATRPGREASYVYDENGRRVLKLVNGEPAVGYVADGLVTAEGFLESVAVGGITVGILENGVFRSLLTDPRGTPMVDEQGAAYPASPYGVRTRHHALAELIDYARLGYDADLEAVRMGVRDYDPYLGQFRTPDPKFLEDLAAVAGSPLEANLVGYAKGNPVSFVDPTGTDAKEMAAWWKEELERNTPFFALGEVFGVPIIGIHPTRYEFVAPVVPMTLKMPASPGYGERLNQKAGAFAFRFGPMGPGAFRTAGGAYATTQLLADTTDVIIDFTPVLASLNAIRQERYGDALLSGAGDALGAAGKLGTLGGKSFRTLEIIIDMRRVARHGANGAAELGPVSRVLHSSQIDTLGASSRTLILGDESVYIDNGIGGFVRSATEIRNLARQIGGHTLDHEMPRMAAVWHRLQNADRIVVVTRGKVDGLTAHAVEMIQRDDALRAKTIFVFGGVK